MPIFNYQARTKDGDIQDGRVEAPNKKVAADILHRHNLVIVVLEESQEAPIYARRLKFFEKVKKKDLVIFSRQLTTLFQAEVPLLTALRTVARQTENNLFKETIFEISADVEGGTTLSDALSGHPKIFSQFYVNMIRAGEASGKIDEVLSYLAGHIERDYEVNSRVKGALIYPAFVVSGFFIAVAVMMIYVIPRLTSVLEQSGQDLPVLTDIIIGSSQFMRSYWYLVLIAIIGGGWAFLTYIKTKQGKKMWDAVQLKLPIFGSILTKVYLFRFSESLATLIEGGLPLTRALSISADVSGNEVYKNIIKRAQDEVRGGGSIGGALSAYKEMPPLVTQMISVGEQAGKLVDVLKSISRFYQKDVDSAVDNITSLIEPILITVMGLGVGALVAGIMLPIYNMAGSF